MYRKFVVLTVIDLFLSHIRHRGVEEVRLARGVDNENSNFDLHGCRSDMDDALPRAEKVRREGF